MSTEPTALPAAVVAAIDEYGVTCANVVKMRTSPEWENWAREKLEAAILLALTHAPASAPGGSTDSGQVVVVHRVADDTARIDWLEKHGTHNGPYCVTDEGDSDSWWELPDESLDGEQGRAYATMRDALDAAMSKERAHA